MQHGKTKQLRNIADEILWGTKFAGIMVSKGTLMALAGAGIVVVAIPAGTALAIFGVVDRLKKKTTHM